MISRETHMPSRLFSLFGLSALFGSAAAADVQTIRGVKYVEVRVDSNPLWDYISLTPSECNEVAIGNGQTGSKDNHDENRHTDSIGRIGDGYAAYKSVAYCTESDNMFLASGTEEIPQGCVKYHLGGIYWGYTSQHPTDLCYNHHSEINTNHLFTGLAQPPPTAEEMLAFIQQEQGC